MKLTTLLLAAVCGCGLSQARAERQPADTLILNSLDAFENTTAPLSFAAKRSPAEQALLHNDVLARDERYFTVSGSTDYLDLVEQARNLIGKPLNVRSSGSQGLIDVMMRTNNLKAIHAEPQGYLPDGGRRESIVFELPTKKLGMLTVWDYVADGGRIILDPDFARQKVGEAPASLALVKAQCDDRRMWKLGWTTNTGNYELYLEDAKTADQDTYWSPDAIIGLAEKMMGF